MTRKRIKSPVKRKGGFPWFWIIVAALMILGIAFIIIGSREQPLLSIKGKPDESADSDTSSIDFIVRIDGAIQQACLDLGVGNKSILWKRNKDIGQLPGIKFSNITIKVNSAFPMAHVNSILQSTIVDSGGRIVDAYEKKAGSEIAMKLAYGDIMTHQLRIRRKSGASLKPAYVALLIDDFGQYSVPTARKFFALGIKFSASILPNAEFTQYILRELDKHADIERMVHIPMEPKGYPKFDPGAGAIFVSQDDREILRLTQDAIKAIPGAVGANNHMGSKATENSRVMYQVLRAIRDAGFFWVDSRTTQYSVSEEIAISMGIPAMRIDHVIDPSSLLPDEIEKRLFDYCLAARRMPAMIISCHCSDTTLQILEKNIPVLKKFGIKFITVSHAKEKKSAARADSQ